jgi:glycosyltransferase involved in cell wall biosynthesis
MPPSATGVADYSAALLPHLQAIGEVAVNTPGDVNVYHVGNNALHREIYRRAIAEPGVVVLHDAVLQHFFLGSLDEAAYSEEFVFNYGEWSRALAGELWRERARSGADARYFARPMVKRVVRASRAVIVHNPTAAAIARAHGAERVFEIPHLFVTPQVPSVIDTLRFRQELGAPPNVLLVGTFGHQRETKRLAVLVRAFEAARARAENIRLLVTGEFVSKAYAQAMEPLLVQAGALRAGHLPEDEFWKYLAATDLCVNLRYPTAAETSGVAIRMMGLGKAVVFTNDDATRRYPENACLRLDVGPSEESMLADYMVWLAGQREAAAMIGENAKRYITREHGAAKVASAYWEAVRV